MICAMFAPSAFMIPISRRFCTVTVMSVLMIPKAATTTMKNKRKNITRALEPHGFEILAGSCRSRSERIPVAREIVQSIRFTRSALYGLSVLTVMPCKRVPQAV